MVLFAGVKFFRSVFHFLVFHFPRGIRDDNVEIAKDITMEK